MKVIENVAIR